MAVPSHLCLALATATCCALVSPAAAESNPSSEILERRTSTGWSKRHPWSVSLHTGVATPYGALGLELERTISPSFAIAIGGGQGPYDQQIATSLRLRTIRRGVALGLSIGPGFGDSENFTIASDQTLRHDNALWLNGEVYAEYRTSSRLLFRLYGGGTTTILSDCDDSSSQGGHPSCASDSNLSHPVIGFAFGYAL